MGIQQGDYYTEETMFKVFKALRKVGLNEEDATDAINELQNVGILFREKRPVQAGISQPVYREREIE